jgi:coatomer subunit beta
LRDLTIDFATLGDLKLVERPVPHTLAPHGFHTIKATIKVGYPPSKSRRLSVTDIWVAFQVSSTETGVIFGNVVYEKQGASDSSVNIVLNDIHVDIMDYIKPAYCNEAQVSVPREHGWTLSSRGSFSFVVP